MTNQTRTEPLDRLAELAAKATEMQVHPVNWTHWVGMVMMAGPARNFVAAASPTVVSSLIAEAREAARLRSAAEALLVAWDEYGEAHAGRGHVGEHEPDRLLDGDCGPCAGACYGTEVQMGEYAVPALRAALVKP